MGTFDFSGKLIIKRSSLFLYLIPDFPVANLIPEIIFGLNC